MLTKIFENVVRGIKRDILIPLITGHNHKWVRSTTMSFVLNFKDGHSEDVIVFEECFECGMKRALPTFKYFIHYLRLIVLLNYWEINVLRDEDFVEFMTTRNEDEVLNKVMEEGQARLEAHNKRLMEYFKNFIRRR